MKIDFRPEPELFPFESRWYERDGIRMHYVDEGAGRPIVLLHGNPTWSFLYRDVITGLRDSFRCIAVDYPGFGLSDRPRDYGYTPREHAEFVIGLTEQLGLRDMVVMGQDWGGPIGMALALHAPDNVHGLVFANTWYWPADSFAFKAFSFVMSSPPMRWAILQRNFFVNRIIPSSVAKPLQPRVMEHYRAVQPTPEARRGVAVFPREIRKSRPWLAQLAADAPRAFASTPMLLIWGLKDRAFGSQRAVRDRWKRDFPHADVVEIPDASHYIQEDAGLDVAAAIKRKFGAA